MCIRDRRKAINNAKAELNGEMGSITSEFDDIRGPLTQAAQWTRLGPKGAITKALFDGDESAWDDFNPKKMAENVKTATAPQEPEEQTQPQPQQQRPSFDYSQIYAEQPQPEPQPQQRPQAPQPTEPPAPEKKPPHGGEESTGGGLWGDVT